MSMPARPTERNSLEAEFEQATEDEALAAAEAVRAKRRTEFLLTLLSTAKAAPASESRQFTRAEYARRSNVSEATVSRWLAGGMPATPVGTTVRIDPVEADKWRRARGRKPTTRKADEAHAEKASDVDVSDSLAQAGLRIVGSGR